MKNALREGVSFVCQDIRIDLPPGPFDLILCRNLAFTYFAVAQQVRTVRHLATRLRNGGVLVIGAHERLPVGATNFRPLLQCPYILVWHGAEQI